MAVITKITSQKRNSNRFNIYLDGEYSFPVSEEVLFDFGLKNGISLTETEVSKIQAAENFQKFYLKTLDFIAYRIRTKAETIKRLREYFYKDNLEKEISEQLEEKIVAKLEKANFLNDEEFVKSYIESAKNSKTPPGAQKIKEFLYKKGVEKDLIDKYLLDYSKTIESIGLEKLLEKKLKMIKNRSFKEKQKIIQYLLRKGYSYEAIQPLVDKEFEV